MTKKRTKDEETSLFASADQLQTKEPAAEQKVVDEAPAKKSGEVAIAEAKPKRRGQLERVVPQTGLGDILATFERLAVNPNVNPDTLGKLLDVQERLLDRNARMAFDASMVEMQPELPEVTKDGRIVVREKNRTTGARNGEITQDTPYAKWETMMPLIKPILHKFGFGIRHRVGTSPDGNHVRVTAILHGHGHTDDSCYFDLLADSTGSKNNAQAWASSISYGKRHTACAVLNIVTKDEDNDGNSAGKKLVIGEPITLEELDQLVTFAGAVECPKAHLIKHLNDTKPKGHPELKDLANLPKSRFEQTLADLKSYEANKRARYQKPAETQK